MRSFLRTLLSLAVVHWLTSIGVVLTTASAAVFLALVFQRFENPYFGIVVFLIIPALFVLGLVLMPFGVFLAGRRMGGYRQLREHLPQDRSGLARVGWAFAFATLVNVGILMAVAYQGVGYMDSREFCGQTCHSVMQPQYVRYQNSSHARVPCVDCHIGSGATSFLQYELAGVRQLVRVTTDTYQRPIPPAMDRMRPAKDTCEACHSSQKMQEDRLKVIRHYGDDEHSTEKITVLLMKVGSRIHKAHIGRDVEYVSATPDPQTISTVIADGKTYSVEGSSTSGAMRKMDCMDCHNRSGHDFETADTAVERAIVDGLLDRSRAFARRDAVAALTGKAPMEQQPAPVQEIYRANVYPAMKITWGTYPNNVGHERSAGCFRCHDGQHVTKSGDSITQDCASCHELVAVEEQNPKILKDLGVQ